MWTQTKMQASLILLATMLAGLQQGAQAEDGVAPTCEICGCDACPPGFEVGNPNGIIAITQEIFDEFGSIVVPPLDENSMESTLEETLTNLGFGLGSMLPCSLLDAAATSGLFPIEACTDLLRLNPIVRDTCGCPAVPPPATDSPTSAPTTTPVAAATPPPTAIPTAAPTAEPSPAPTDPPVDAPTEPPVPAPTDPPVDAPTEPPVDAPTEPPVPAPTDPPMDAPTDPPVPAPTDPPAPVPTAPPMMVMTNPPVLPTPDGDSPFPELPRCTTMRRKRKQ